MYKYLILIPIMALLLVSCDQPIAINLNDYQPKMVVQAEWGADSLPKLFLTESQSYYGYLESEETYKFVRDANVKILSDGQAQALDTTGEWGYPFYPYAPNLAPEDSVWLTYYKGTTPITLGKTYDLEITHEGRELKGSTTVPQPVSLTRLAMEEKSDFEYAQRFVAAYIDDPAGETAGYRLRYSFSAWNYQIDYINGEPVYYDSTYVNYDFVSPIETDEGRDGSQVRIEVYPYNISYDGVPDTFQIVCQLETLSGELGEYYKSLEDQRFGVDPLSEPTLIRSNVEGGLGVVGSFSVSDTMSITFITEY